jgi:hypothetical protein
VVGPLCNTEIAEYDVFRSALLPTSQVVTSFPSKAELGLHIGWDRQGPHLVFVGYGSPGVGALDASNSDAVPGQDPTNPVTFAFGTDYAFHRTIVSMDAEGHFSYTPTVNYGGNNGRLPMSPVIARYNIAPMAIATTTRTVTTDNSHAARELCLKYHLRVRTGRYGRQRGTLAPESSWWVGLVQTSRGCCHHKRRGS